MVEESRDLSFHGVRAHFRVAAPEGAPRERLLLLCSPLITVFHWRKLLPELDDLGCLTVMLDLPGFGRSSCSATVPQDDFTRANIAWGVLDDVDRATSSPGALWHLAGHGSACGTLLEMAALYPDSVKSQVHISPLPRCPDPFGRTPPERWFRDNVLDKAGFRRWMEKLCGHPLDDYILDRMRAPLLRPGTLECFRRMLLEHRKLPDARAEFCPVMVLLGGRDALLDANVRGDISACLPGSELHELKSAGHFPMETHSRALRDYLRGWMKYIDGE